MDVDFYVYKNKDSEELPTIRIFAVNDFENSILLHVHNFNSYFYVETPLGFDFSEQNINEFRKVLGDKGKAGRTINNFKRDPIISIEIVYKENIRGFKAAENSKKSYLKISTALPSFISTFRGIFEKGFIYGDMEFSRTVFEANMPFALRFMIDIGMVGMAWMRLKGGTYNHRKLKEKISRC